MRCGPVGMVLLLAALGAGPLSAAPSTRAEALAALAEPDPMDRFVAIERLAEVGTMADADRVLARLADPDARVRIAASNAIWRIWSRSGDPAIDALLARGVEQMDAFSFAEALASFDEVVRRRPEFAEGWNKRATVHYLMGDLARSLADCEEVFRRNPRHFGALAGAGQIRLRQGRPDLALDLFRRAVAINPNLDGPAQMIPQLEKLQEVLDRNRT